MLHLLLAAAALVAAPADDPQEKTVSAATAAMTAGRPEQALTTIEPALAAYERQHAGERRQVFCGYSPVETVAEMAAAAAAKREAVALSSGWCDALFIKGYALADLRRFAEARPVLERAVAMAPFHAHFINELAYVYQQQRDWQLSYDTYVRARDATAYSDRKRVTPEKGRALRGMGFALIELGKWDEAEALFNESLVLEPGNANALNELRYIAQQRRRPRA